MDIPRGKEVARRRIIRRITYLTLIAVAVALAFVGVWRLKPAAPTVERATVLIDTVKRGPMLRNMRGLGTLVVEHPVWISAQSDGRVERINLLPGSKVGRDDVLIVLSNPDMELAAADLEWQVKAAEATYTDLKVRLETSQLAQKATTEQVGADYEQAELTADRDQQLTKLGLKSDLDTKLSVAKAADLKARLALSKQQLDISGQSIEAQLAAQKVQIEKLQAAYVLKRRQV